MCAAQRSKSSAGEVYCRDTAWNPGDCRWVMNALPAPRSLLAKQHGVRRRASLVIIMTCKGLLVALMCTIRLTVHLWDVVDMLDTSCNWSSW
jgi:hypothetical protein